MLPVLNYIAMQLPHGDLWKVCLDYLTRPCAVILGAVTAFIYSVWGCEGQTPILVCGDGFRAFLERHCPVVAERFIPTPWCWGGRLQTVTRVFIKSSPPISYRNELIRTVDGGQISLDWVDNLESAVFPDCGLRPTVLILPGLTGNSRQTYILHAVSQATRRGYSELIRTVDGGQISLDWVDNLESAVFPDCGLRPTVLILPGLTGNSRQTYILHAVSQATRRGYRTVVFNNRGFGGEDLLTPQTFSAADTSDLECVVTHIKDLYPKAPLMGAGISLGGMLLLNYLARKGNEAGLLAGLTMSVSWDTLESCASLERPLNKVLFNWHLAANLCRAVNRHRKILESVVDVDHVLQSRTIREFDERYTTVMFGYKTCRDYYRDASPCYKLAHTAIPVLCLNAADDPFSPEHTIPVEQAQQLPNVALLVTARGGHIGFLEGLFPRGESYMDRLFGQFVQAVFENPGDLRGACKSIENDPTD
ncbi:ABHD3 Phospholipase, partial [Atractosteus spatula]|nr:ABHD3 Phospholipase [Atractosteus spatula]